MKEKASSVYLLLSLPVFFALLVMGARLAEYNDRISCFSFIGFIFLLLVGRCVYYYAGKKGGG